MGESRRRAAVAVNSTSELTVLVEELVKWEKSSAVAIWERRPGPRDRYLREVSLARDRLRVALRVYEATLEE